MEGVRWDLTSYFPSFGGEEMVRFRDALLADAENILREATDLDTLDIENFEEWEAMLLHYEDFEARQVHYASYIECICSANSDSKEYAAEEATAAKVAAARAKIEIEIQAGLKGITSKVFNAFSSRPAMSGARLRLERLRAIADHTMTTGQERLAADLAVDGLHSWSRLYENMTGRMSFRMNWPDGKVERLPISSYYGLVASVDRQVGRAAFEGALTAWEEREDVLAAALNAISGFTTTLWKYRHYRDVLEVPLHQTGIKRKTLDAMYRAIRANIELPRAIFREKAKFMGRKGIEWFEREAPLPLRESGLLSWEQGSRMVHDSFLRVYPELGMFYGQMLDRRWIESEARAGKRPGAFQTASYITGEPRVFMVYNGTLTDVATLAHEVGHAWHDHLLRDTRVFARRYPTTMGETASVFAEHLFAEGVYRDPSVPDLQKLMMLDSDLCGAALFLLDITVRFDFERQFYEERKKGEVGAHQLREMMASTQRQVMGSALLEGGEHPMLWATKVHFFLTDRAFYNFPYTFGFLLSLAMYERMLDQGESFLRAYELFLKRSGSGPVEQVAFDTLGEDITREDFWTRSIKSLASPVDLYTRLLQSEKKAVSVAGACVV